MKQINRVLAALLSLAIIVVGVLFIIEVIANAFTSKPAIIHWHSAYNWAGRTTWNAGNARAISIVLAAVGVILLLAELKRPRVTRLALTEEQSGIDAAYTRRGVATAISSAAGDVDGIRTVQTKVKRRKVIVTATSGAADATAAGELREPLVQTAQARLDSIGLKSAPSLSATVKPRSN